MPAVHVGAGVDLDEDSCKFNSIQTRVEKMVVSW
jgi:hypothetical protein